MKVTPLAIFEVVQLEPQVFGFGLSFFFENINQVQFGTFIGKKVNFVQDNYSHFAKKELRSLQDQIKRLHGVVAGEVFDAGMYLRKIGLLAGEILSGRNKKEMWINDGFAVLSEAARFFYIPTHYWAQEHKRCIVWNAPLLLINWIIQGEPMLSGKEAVGAEFETAKVFA